MSRSIDERNYLHTLIVCITHYCVHVVLGELFDIFISCISPGVRIIDLSFSLRGVSVILQIAIMNSLGNLIMSICLVANSQ